MEPRLTQNMAEMITELANWFLFTFLLFIGIMAFYAIWHMRVKKMREYRRRKYSEDGLSDKLDITSVLPDLSRDEMKKIAINEKARKEDESIDLENYGGLPLKPKVYFDPKKDSAADASPPEPKIKRSFLSNEPLPRPEASEKRSVEEIYKANEVSMEFDESSEEGAEENGDTVVNQDDVKG